MISRSTFEAIDESRRLDVERHDRALGAFGETLDEAVTDLAAGPGDEDDRFAHPGIIPAAIA